MDERRRFQVALGGVASCLLIAALFVSSAPPVVYPAVSRPAVESSTPLRAPHSSLAGPEPFVPAPVRAAERRPARPVVKNGGVTHLVAARHETPSAPPIADEPLRPRAHVIAPTPAPATHAVFVTAHLTAAAQPSETAEHRGPVTDAFVTAGKEVGRGFRIAGRALRSIF
jgi:hypothetical protein